MNRAARPGRAPRHPALAFGGWLLLVVVLLATFVPDLAAGMPDRAAAGEASTQQPTAQQPARAQQVARGGEIYQQACARCHGGSGRGSDIGPSLRGLSSTYIDLVLRTNRMPPGDLSPDTRGDTKGSLDLSEEDRLAVVAFTEEVFGLEGEIPEVPEGDAARGLLVWGTHCAACHGASGQGGVAGRGAFTPPVAGLDAVTIAEAVRIGPFDMPRFSESVVDDQEIADVAAFMARVAEEPSTPIGLTETNPVYLAGLAGLLSLVVLLSCLWLAGRPVHFRGSRPPEPRSEQAPSEQERNDG